MLYSLQSFGDIGILSFNKKRQHELHDPALTPGSTAAIVCKQDGLCIRVGAAAFKEACVVRQTLVVYA